MNQFNPKVVFSDRSRVCLISIFIMITIKLLRFDFCRQLCFLVVNFNQVTTKREM